MLRGETQNLWLLDETENVCEEGEPVGTSTVKARAAIVVNFLLSSWRIREAAERARAADRAASLFFHGEATSGLYER